MVRLTRSADAEVLKKRLAVIEKNTDEMQRVYKQTITELQHKVSETQERLAKAQEQLTTVMLTQEKVFVETAPAAVAPVLVEDVELGTAHEQLMIAAVNQETVVAQPVVSKRVRKMPPVEEMTTAHVSENIVIMRHVKQRPNGCHQTHHFLYKDNVFMTFANTTKNGLEQQGSNTSCLQSTTAFHRYMKNANLGDFENLDDTAEILREISTR
jgi:hypothetical protein